MPKFLIELDDETYTDLALFALGERRRTKAQAEWMLTQMVKARVKQERALRHLDGAPSAEAETEGEP